MSVEKGKYSKNFKTPIGTLCLTATSLGLYSLDFLRSKSEILDSRSKAPTRISQLLSCAALRIRKYLEGEPVHFSDFSLDWADLKPFEKRVLRELRKIPRGSTVNYQDLARRGGRPKASRHVGRIMHLNRLPLILPCHRVLPKNGGWGGFSKGVGLKRHLLKLESAGADKKLGRKRAV